MKNYVYGRIEESGLDYEAQSPDPRWKMPPLPLPRSSDVSPVSSDMYISPLESELLNGSFSPKEPAEDEHLLRTYSKNHSVINNLPLGRSWSRDAAEKGKESESRFETFCLRKTYSRNLDSFGRLGSTQPEDRTSPLGTYRVLRDQGVSRTPSQAGSPRQRILSDIAESNSSSGGTFCQCVNTRTGKNCKKRCRVHHTADRLWYD